MADPALNPFLDDVFDASRPDFSRGDVEWIHLSALVRLKMLTRELAERQDFGAGKVALVTAPRAGFGKTHLVSHLGQLIGEGALSLPLHFEPDSDLTWAGLLGRTVEQLDSTLEPGGKCTLLDGIGRRAFATATRQMISEAKIPCADPAEAMAALDRDPIGLFDLGNSAQVVGHWFNQYFGQLRPTVAEILARRSGISVERANIWASLFHKYGSVPDESTRGGAFRASLPQNEESAAKQSLHEILRLATTPRPAILIADDLDGFYRDRDAGQRIAHMLLDVAKMTPRALVVIGANEDLWEASFGVHIASAYEDRLTAQRIRLGGISSVQARQLVRDRVLLSGKDRDTADEFDSYLALGALFTSGGSARAYSPRDILRYASTQWGRFLTGEPSAFAERDQTELAPEAEPDAELAPMPTPARIDSRADDVDAAPGSSNSPTGIEIFDELTRDSISEAAQSLVSPKSVPKAPVAPAEDPITELPEHQSGSTDEIVPELVGHTQPAAPPSVGKNGNSGGIDAPKVTTTDFAEDEDNPFQKLKRMLSKLRSEREEQRQTDSQTLVEAERKRIEREGIDPVKSLAPLHRRDVDLPLSPDEDDAAPTTREPGVLADFQRERELILSSGTSLPIIQTALGTLAAAAGDRFPVITLDEAEIAPDATAIRWSFDENEILFGNRPGRDRDYWKSLGEFAVSRSADGSAKIKMIVFSSADDPVDVDTILRGSDDLIGIADFTVLDRKSLASLYAAHRLLTGTAASGEPSGGDSEDILGKLAGELDFFWKRVTRPLPEVVKS